MIELENCEVPLESNELLPVSYLGGVASQTIPVPTLYAIRFLCRELESTLDTLLQCQELQELLSIRTEEKEEIHTRLKRLLKLYQEFLMIDTRR